MAKKKYISRFAEVYKIVMKPAVSREVAGQVITEKGKMIEFKNGVYETEDVKEQKFLDESPMKNRDYVDATKGDEAAVKMKTLEQREAEVEEKERKAEEKEKEEIKEKGKGNEEGGSVSVKGIRNTKSTKPKGKPKAAF